MRMVQRGISFIIALITWMMLATVAGAEGLLFQQMNGAYEAGREIVVETQINLGSGVLMMMPENTFEATNGLLSEARIITRWAKGDAGEPTMALEVVVRDTQILTATASMQADGVAVVTSLVKEKTLLVPYESLGDVAATQPMFGGFDEESVAVLSGALQVYLNDAMSWAMESEGLLTQNSIERPATDVRDASTGSIEVNLTGLQLRDLLLRWSDTFSKDTDLHAAMDSYLSSTGNDISAAELAEALRDEVNRLTPTPDGNLQLTTLTGPEGELVGLDFAMNAMFEQTPQTAFAQFDRRTILSGSAYAFQGKVGFDGGGMAATIVHYQSEMLADSAEEKSDLMLRGMYQPSGEAAISQITLTDARQNARTEDHEKLDGQTELTYGQLDPSGAEMQDVASMSVGLSTLCVTDAGAGDDFRTEASFVMTLMGMDMTTVKLNISTREYRPIDTSGYAVIDLTKIGEEEMATLGQELENGLMQAAATLMPLLPAELTEMM